MNIEKLDDLTRAAIARAHKKGDYAKVLKILVRNKIKASDCCLNAYEMMEWCVYWTKTNQIPDGGKT